MTKEEKAKRYDEALKRAKEWSETKNGYYTPKELCEEIFPELKIKESEDERIRKAIIDLVLENIGQGIMNHNNVDCNDMIAWLEKKPAEWTEKDEDAIGMAIIALEDMYDEDEPNTTYGGYNLPFNKAAERLKSLRHQINVTDKELAQAKKEAYNEALDKIEYHSGEPTFDDGWNAAIWYLKKRNGKPQNTWKPSDEQMKVLDEVLNFAANHESPYWNDYIFETLNNLIRQLKN